MAIDSTTLADTRSSSLTTFTLKTEGEDLPGTYRVVFMDITKSFNKITSAKISLLDGDPATQKFDISSEDKLIPGNTIEIFGGYNSNETLLFKGVIVKQNIKLKKRRDSMLTIECKDQSFLMSLARRSKYHIDLSDSELFEDLVSGYENLSIEIESTNTQHAEIVQYQLSDWDLMISRAEKEGLYCLTDDGVIKLFKPDINQESVTTLTYGRNIFDFELQLDASSQFEEVTATSWDIAEQELLSTEVSDIQIPAQGNIDTSDLVAASGSNVIELKHSGRLSQEEVDGWAEAQMQRVRFAKIRGTIKIQGTEVIKPGNLITLEGLGDRFNGLALVSGVRHSLGKGDWVTTLQVGEDPRWHQQKYDVNAKSASGFHAPIKGLHIGVVTQLENDPIGEERILVRLPIISPDHEGIWSRLATLDAGENRGTVIRPEIGDEVVVGFIDEDPDQALVLGMLHSSNKPAPIAASDDNHEKGWITRSNMKLVFNDDAPSFTIETPQGNKIVISDENASIVINDEHGSSITMDSEGISLDSAKNIILKAQQDIKLESMNIEAKATLNVNVEGGSGAVLKSSGTTDVKGSLVQIN